MDIKFYEHTNVLCVVMSKKMSGSKFIYTTFDPAPEWVKKILRIPGIDEARVDPSNRRIYITRLSREYKWFDMITGYRDVDGLETILGLHFSPDKVVKSNLVNFGTEFAIPD